MRGASGRSAPPLLLSLRERRGGPRVAAAAAAPAAEALEPRGPPVRSATRTASGTGRECGVRLEPSLRVRVIQEHATDGGT